MGPPRCRLTRPRARYRQGLSDQLERSPAPWFSMPAARRPVQHPLQGSPTGSTARHRFFVKTLQNHRGSSVPFRTAFEIRNGCLRGLDDSVSGRLGERCLFPSQNVSAGRSGPPRRRCREGYSGKLLQRRSRSCGVAHTAVSATWFAVAAFRQDSIGVRSRFAPTIAPVL